MGTYKNTTVNTLTDQGTSGVGYTWQANETKTIPEILPNPLTPGLTLQDYQGYSPIIYCAIIAASQTVVLPQIPLNPMGLPSGVSGQAAYRVRIYGISGTTTVAINGIGSGTTLLTVPTGVLAWDRQYNSRYIDNLVITVSTSSIWICVEQT